MPDPGPQILSVALIIFVSIGVVRLSIELLASAGKLTIEELISLIIRFKKLKATMKSEYSLESGKLEMRELAEPDEVSTTITARSSVPHIHSKSDERDSCADVLGYSRSPTT